MAKKDRTGNRKTREQRKQFKVPELGYYLIGRQGCKDGCKTENTGGSVWN